MNDQYQLIAELTSRLDTTIRVLSKSETSDEIITLLFTKLYKEIEPILVDEISLDLDIENLPKSKLYNKSTTRGKKIPNVKRNKKIVMQVETGIIFNSITEAQEITGINSIARSALNERFTSGGFHWEYI